MRTDALLSLLPLSVFWFYGVCMCLLHNLKFLCIYQFYSFSFLPPPPYLGFSFSKTILLPLFFFFQNDFHLTRSYFAVTSKFSNPANSLNGFLVVSTPFAELCFSTTDMKCHLCHIIYSHMF